MLGAHSEAHASGIAFGVFEGVQYQVTINAQMDYTSAFYSNIARLTSLPFLHAIWCAIAGYFIAFANFFVTNVFPQAGGEVTNTSFFII